MRQPILIMFGGESAEHEVSVVTGLQALENIDTDLYEPMALYVDKKGLPWLMSGLQNRKQFLSAKREMISFGKDEKGGFVQTAGILGKKIYPYAAYLCFHGGTGESGPIEGLLESLGIPHTGPSSESAAITMNKALTKTIVTKSGVATVPSVSIRSADVIQISELVARRFVEEISLPAIVKPAHLGSSIGITVAKTEIELEKALIEATHLDCEIVVEKFLPNITEYNIAVRRVGNNIEVSEIERPLSKDEILSFADKYERGGKKTGTGSGMASLSRELPAKIPPELKLQIEENAKVVYAACRCTSMVRIDFMQSDPHSGEASSQLYLTEINPIPGSMAYYLWESSGIPFQKQITDAVEEAVREQKEMDSRQLDYKTDIIDKFVKG